MRRAVILILVMLVLGTAAGLWMQTALDRLCEDYLGRVEALRSLVEEDRLVEALTEQAYLFARWQGEEGKLKALVSHHHTRAADEALLRLTTALEHGWRKEALLSLDTLRDALEDLREDVRLMWENVL